MHVLPPETLQNGHTDSIILQVDTEQYCKGKDLSNLVVRELKLTKYRVSLADQVTK